MKKLIITGGNGYIASIVDYFNKGNFEITKLDKEEMDLANLSMVEEILMNSNFDIILHAGAIPDTLTCEKYPDETYKVNVLSTKKIAEICKLRDKEMMFISSEQVFNGLDKRGPHTEEQQPKSVTVYGNHKIECENYIQSLNMNAKIIRFSWMFGLGFENIDPSYNIIKIILRALCYQKETKFTVNERRGFTYSHNFARQFKSLLSLPNGIYNYSSKNILNTYETAKYIAELLSFDAEAIDKYILPNKERYRDRFRDFSMDSSKLKKHGIDLNDLTSQIQQLKKEFRWIENEH